MLDIREVYSGPDAESEFLQARDARRMSELGESVASLTEEVNGTRAALAEAELLRARAQAAEDELANVQAVNFPPSAKLMGAKHKARPPPPPKAPGS